MVNIIHFTCQYCGKEVTDYASRKTKFCTPQCWYAYRKEHQGTFKECEQCGKIFKVKGKTQRFCSKECKFENQKTLIGELSPKYHQVHKICEVCGKEFSVKQSKQDSARFCSNDCRNIWYAEIVRSDERKKLAAKTIISNIVNGKIQQAMTKPHQIISGELDEMGIEHLNEYQVGYYVADIYIVKANLLIEIMGDFWHSNPTTKYGDARLPQQKSRIGKDKAKHTYILNQYGIEVLYLWENDIIHNIELCKKLILEYINNNGSLSNYHSFNYFIGENNISLKEGIAVPKFALECGVNSSTI